MMGAMTSPRHSPPSRNVSPRRSRIPARVDRLLPERAESLALERRVAVAHLPAGEERLQPVVGRAREHHAAQDLAALVRRQRGADRRAMEEPVAGVHELFDRELEALRRLDAGRRLQALGRRQVLQACPEGGFEGRAERVERRLVGLDRRLARVERGAHGRHGEGKRSTTNASRRRARSVAG